MGIRKATLLLLLFAFGAVGASGQQTYTVRGHVTADDLPVLGATVVEVGTTRGTSTDIYGQFSLEVSGPNAMIQVSYLGYIPVTLRADSNLFLQGINLEQDATTIDDVVVIGYGTVRKNDMTGSVSVIKADDINRGSVVGADEMMLGKVAGLQVIPGSGQPGEGSTIRIRGAASLNASNDPLIVIDGVPIANDPAPGSPNALASINPNDIESYTILKDASATAIYGSRASNGVIIITTKKGKGSVPTVSYNSSYYINTNINTVQTLSADEYRSFMLDFYPEGTANGTRVRELMGDASTDWQDKVYRNAFGTDQNLSVYGNWNDRLPYRVSTGYTKEDGTLRTSTYQRGTLDISLAPTFFQDHLTVNVNAKGVYNKNNYPDSGVVNSAAFFDPTQSVHFWTDYCNVDYNRSKGWFNWFNEIQDANGNVTGYSPNSLAAENPMSLLYERYDRNYVQRFLGNAQFDYKFHFLPDLRANLNLGLDVTSTDGKKGTNSESFGALKDTDYPIYGKNETYYNFRRNQLLEFYLAYDKNFGRHHFDILGGYSWQNVYKNNKNTTYINCLDELFYDGPYEPSEYYLVSFFGRANYSFAGKYLVTATLRGDASSRFAKDNRWGVFPSVALAWNIAEEDFLKDNRTVSELKLRVGGGSTGQQEIEQGDYPYIPRYTLQTDPGTNYYLGDGYYSPLQPLGYNQNIKWEVTDTYNIGIDYGFFRGRLSGSVDAYLRKTKDLLNEVSIPLGANFTNRFLTNIGNMENKGVEFSINAIPISNSDWTWNVNFNGTWQDTKITKLTNAADDNYMVHVGGISSGTGGTIQVHKVGYAPYSFYTYQQAYDSDGMPLQNVFVDRNGDGRITDEDRYISGKSPMPKFYMGLSSTLRYRNWDLGFNAHASFGNWLYNDFYASNATPTGDFLSQGFLVNLTKTALKTGFTETNSNQQVYSDMFIENASFFKMDNITLGYTFRNIGSSRLNIRTSFSVQNVFTITDYSGLDPEVGVFGIDNNLWPRPRTYTLRLSVNF